MGILKKLEDRATYQPDKVDYGFAPKGAEPFFINDSLGNKIHLLFKDNGSKRTLIFCHGRDGNLTKFKSHNLLFEQLGVNLLTFDYPGYGQSSGAPSETSLYSSAQAAYNYLVQSRSLSPANIIVYGLSLGGAVAIELVKNNPVAGLILESTFTCSHDVARLIYTKIPLYWLVKNRYKSIEKISSLNIPILFVHGDKDARIPIDHSKRLFQSANQPKDFYEVSGAGHVNLVLTGGEQYTQKLREFISRLD